jgi:hypothetical protein
LDGSGAAKLQSALYSLRRYQRKCFISDQDLP